MLSTLCTVRKFEYFRTQNNLTFKPLAPQRLYIYSIDLNSTPRGSHAILAQQIEQEISELRNIFEDHKEEMMCAINEERERISTVNTGCSPIMFENTKIR